MSTNLELLLSGKTPLLDVALETADRILGATHTLNLLTGTVSGTGVGHRVTAVAVSDKLHEKWAIAFRYPLASVLHSVSGSDDVHAIDLKTFEDK